MVVFPCYVSLLEGRWKGFWNGFCWLEKNGNEMVQGMDWYNCFWAWRNAWNNILQWCCPTPAPSFFFLRRVLLGQFFSLFNRDCPVLVWHCMMLQPQEKLTNFLLPSLRRWEKNRHTLPKFNIAPENIPSQKESSLPTIIFQGRAVKLRGCIQLISGQAVWIKVRKMLEQEKGHISINLSTSPLQWWRVTYQNDRNTRGAKLVLISFFWRAWLYRVIPV